MKTPVARRLRSVLLAFAGIGAAAAQPPVQLPPETVKLKPSTRPGYAVAQRECTICHSSDYIAYQPPGMNLAQWTGEVMKMHINYGAPIAGDLIREVGFYLTSVYGAGADAAGAETTTPPAAAAAASVDASTLLAQNGCLGCHAVKQKVVGPSYHDVATKYRADPDALTKLQQSIRAGGSGRWGQVPMPPFANLGEAQLRALAEYVLKQ